MSRYIDADLLDDIALQRGITRWEYKMIESVLFDFPTADVVEVVRCKDCKWYKSIFSWNGNEYKICVREPDETPIDYCGYGERREDAEIH